jgi:hypothetical protein
MVSFLLASALVGQQPAAATDLVIQLDNASDVTLVGALRRWDENGDPTHAVDPKAKIESPPAITIAQPNGDGKWLFSGLVSGRYDLIIITNDKTRIEGCGYPPVLEFDPFFDADDQPPAAAVNWIREEIKKSRHYENKVSPLYFAGNDKQVRVLVQLLRDKPTSFDAKLGQAAATLRHEIWQFTHRYGAWSKEKRTRVLDRLLMPKSELRSWTWVWDPALGAIEINDRPAEFRYSIPAPTKLESLPGLHPY